MTGSSPAKPSRHGARLEAVERGPNDTLVVRRSGKAPLRFKGDVVAAAAGGPRPAPTHEQDTPQGCSLAVARRARGGWVAAARICDPRLRGGGFSIAWDAASLEEIAGLLERYDPSADMMLRARAHRAGSTTAAQALAEVALRQRIAAARLNFQDAAGRVLNALQPPAHAVAA